MAFLDFALKLLFPHVCLNCRRLTETDAILCAPCAAEIQTHRTFFCGLCRARLPEAEKICHKETPFILGAAADYDSAVIKNLVRGLKFEGIKKAGDALGHLLADYVCAIKDIAQHIAAEKEHIIVIPVPLSDKRLRERGFNQSEIIAQAFANRYGLQIEPRLLARTRNTKPQSDARNLNERLENVSGCFEVKNKGPLARARDIILVDDVITSGATMRAAAKELKKSGARKIIALVASKA